MTDAPDADTGALRPGDRSVLAAIDVANARVRRALCTLAVVGATMRRDEPRRAGQLLDALAPWPVFKAGQFLFDLMEWEDFMLDADPPELEAGWYLYNDVVLGLLDTVGTLVGSTRTSLTDPQGDSETNTAEASTRVTAPLVLLKAEQQAAVELAPGSADMLTVSLSPKEFGARVDPVRARHVFTAPTGFVFTDHVTYAYFGVDQTTSGTNDPIAYELTDGGRTLTFTREVHVNTGPGDKGFLVYAIGIKAEPGATLGTFRDGQARIDVADPDPLALEATVSDPDPRTDGAAGTDRPLQIAQQSAVRAAPGKDSVLAVSLMPNPFGSRVEPGVARHDFTAPTGFVFNGYVSYAFFRLDQSTMGASTTIEHQMGDGGKTLTFSFDPHMNTGPDDRDLLVYALGVTARTDAEPGTYHDGEAHIDNAGPVPSKLKATITDT